MESNSASLERKYDGGFDSTLVLVSLITLFISYLIYERIANRDSWKKYGVPQGKMGFNIVKSVDELLKDGVDTVGVHLGGMMLITRDLHVLREILVKKFNNFSDRTNFIRTRSHISRGLFFLRGSSWKRMRHIMSPSFSTSRMRRMSPCINTSAQKLAEVLRTCAKEDRLLEAKHTLGQYTCGIIARTGFGLATDCLGEKDNEFTRHCKNLIKVRSAVGRVLQMFFFRFPSLHKFFIEKLKIEYLDSVNMESNHYFNKVLQASIQERSKLEMSNGAKPGDFLQSLVSAHMTSEGTKSSKFISESDMIGQALLILFAAFDTTSTTLQLCLTLLAMHPKIQERVYQEIMEVVPFCHGDEIEEEEGNSKKPSPGPRHEQLQQLHYTQQVIDETLRLYPPASMISRMASQTTTINSIPIVSDTPQADHDSLSNDLDSGISKNICDEDTNSDIQRQVKNSEQSTCQGLDANTTSKGEIKRKSSQNITIPSGAFVLIPIAKIHRNPHYYPDPEKFDPDRFLPEHKAAREPLSFMPFGQGPRQCIGMRMAYLEIKTALVHVLRNVRFEVNEFTEPTAGGKVSVAATGVLVVDKPIKLAVKMR